MFRYVAAAAVAVTMSAGAASAVVVDFEGFATNTAINSIDGPGFAATVTTVSNRANGTNQAVIFDSDNPTGNDTDLGAPFGAGPGNPGPTNPGKILIIAGPDNGQGLPDDDARGGTITFAFDRAVDLLGFDFFDTESGGNELVVTTDLGFMSSLLVTNNGNSGAFDTPLLGVSSVTFDFGGSGAIDNLNIVAAVPLPAALPMFLAVLAGLGYVGRRRLAAA